MRRRAAAVVVIAVVALGACSTGYDQDTPTNVIDKARTVGTDAEERDDRIDRTGE